MLIITPGGARCVFNFRNLCKSNGTHFLGNFPNKIEDKNCKTTSKVYLELNERVPHPCLWDQKTLLIRDIEACQHDEECKFVELQNQNKPTEVTKRKHSDEFQSHKKMKTSFSGDNSRAEDVSQDTATNMDKSKIEINNSTVILSSGGLIEDHERGEEEDREDRESD